MDAEHNRRMKIAREELDRVRESFENLAGWRTLRGSVTGVDLMDEHIADKQEEIARETANEEEDQQR